MTRPPADIPLIVHVIHRLGVGGLENGMVNLINHMPPERYRHAIVCLQGYTDFRKRLRRDDVDIYDMEKRAGNDVGLYLRMYRIFRRLRPAIVHTRNLSALESQVVAALAGVPGRVHGEHGRDIYDLYGKNWKYNLLRKMVRPLVGHYIAVSKDLQGWLIDTIGAAPARTSQIYNGVDNIRFNIADTALPLSAPPEFFGPENIVFGSVGRMAPVKDYPTLVRAFLKLLELAPTLRDRLRLLIVGEGESRAECEALLRQHGAEQLAWFPGERADIPAMMAAMDIFVLPSLGEGISNTILEAMASGLPVIATEVGGNLELVQAGATGFLAAPAAPDQMADLMLRYATSPELRRSHGINARNIIDRQFSMDAMTQGYLSVYDRLLNNKEIN
ncbi:MAG: TIGR03088 family PEP-CTERM/XrtA system glycosyltransferase [Pseudomonadota bacterium]